MSPMDKRTLKALKGSIRKWERIVAGTGNDQGRLNCPLCAEFLRYGCVGCPVYEQGAPYCENTPYASWSKAQKGSYIPFKIHDDDTAIAAVLELEFLRSLLPEEK